MDTAAVGVMPKRWHTAAASSAKRLFYPQSDLLIHASNVPLESTE